MQREIKFRVWDDTAKWWLGHESLSPSGSDPSKLEWTTGSGGMGYLGGEHTLMRSQYTGLKDKNGKEIYEDDIVLVYGDPLSGRTIMFEKGGFCVKCHHKFDVDRLVSYFASDEIEVIGNVYENADIPLE